MTLAHFLENKKLSDETAYRVDEVSHLFDFHDVFATPFVAVGIADC